jgi:hypothetical protein
MKMTRLFLLGGMVGLLSNVGPNEIAFTREVGDNAKENFKATGVESSGPKAPAVVATNKVQSAAPQEPRIPRGRGITLGPDDKPAFDEPPAGIAAKREGIPHGKLEMIEYDSQTVGTKRKMQVYTPPGYTADQNCGNKDGLIGISQGIHAYLKEKGVPHIWHVDGNGHDATHWRNSLWHFSQRIFK